MDDQIIVCGVENCSVPVKAITKGPRTGEFFKYCYEHSQEKKADWSGGSSASSSSSNDNLGAQIGNSLKLAVETALARSPEGTERVDYLAAVLAYAQNYMEIGNTLKKEFSKEAPTGVPQV